jgi:hypothetical protein
MLNGSRPQSPATSADHLLRSNEATPLLNDGSPKLSIELFREQVKGSIAGLYSLFGP